jgi:hypothetical protein
MEELSLSRLKQGSKEREREKLKLTFEMSQMEYDRAFFINDLPMIYGGVGTKERRRIGPI